MSQQSGGTSSVLAQVADQKTRVVKLVLASLFATTSLLTIATVSAGARPDENAEEPNTIAIEGVVRINSEQGWAGINLEVQDEQSGESCGIATTTESGSYSLVLEAPCEVGSNAVAVLPQLDVRKTSDILVLEDRSEPIAFNPIFALTDAEIGGLPDPPTTSGDAPSEVLVQKATSVFDEVELLLIILLVTGAVLLSVMAVSLLAVANRRYRFLDETYKKIDTTQPQNLQFWVKAVEAEGTLQTARYAVFRWMVEGLVMSFVVIALIALGAAGKIEAQGIVSILAALVGYAAGRVTS